MDKKTIGLNSRNERILEELVRAGHFGSEIDAAKFALAHAIKEGTTAGTAESAATKWNVGSVDPDGSLRAVVETLYPGEVNPYRLAEHLMNEGLRLLDKGEARSPDVARILLAEGA